MKKNIFLFVLIIVLLLSACSLPGAESKKSSVPAPSAEVLAESYLRPVSKVETGTAGASLKQVIAAYRVMRFAADQHLSQTDPTALESNLRAAWESLTDEERDSFAEMMSFSIESLIRRVLSESSSMEGLFEDAGIKEEMALLLKEEDVGACVNALLTATASIPETKKD